MRIAKVFPTKTTLSPKDVDSYFGPPEENTPLYDEIHISVTFTWDLSKIKFLQKVWASRGVVKVGGPALGDPGGEYITGRYLNSDVTITSRGCPNKCSFCFIPKREGGLRELTVKPGRIIQDNNILACSDTHKRKVFDMLKTQRKIDFSGGLEVGRIKEDVVNELRQLKIYQLWIAYDRPEVKKTVGTAIDLLRPYFNRNKIRCYVLIGYGDDTIELAEKRLKWVWDAGALPFAMLYHPHTEWKRLQRTWTRPAAMATVMKQSREENNTDKSILRQRVIAEANRKIQERKIQK